MLGSSSTGKALVRIALSAEQHQTAATAGLTRDAFQSIAAAAAQAAPKGNGAEQAVVAVLTGADDGKCAAWRSDGRWLVSSSSLSASLHFSTASLLQPSVLFGRPVFSCYRPLAVF